MQSLERRQPVWAEQVAQAEPPEVAEGMRGMVDVQAAAAVEERPEARDREREGAAPRGRVQAP